MEEFYDEGGRCIEEIELRPNGPVVALNIPIGQFFRYLFLTPAGGSKRHAAQQAYEERLDEAMRRVQGEKER